MREAIGAASKKELDEVIEKVKELRYTIMRYSNRANKAYKMAIISLILDIGLIAYIILTA